MGVYINMEMPKSCFYCPFREKVNPDDYACMALNREFEETFSLIAGKRQKDCPLIPVPPHGRLGDLDKINTSLGAMIEIEHNQSTAPYSWAHAYTEMQSILDDAPTIIPAEEVDDG